jgi:hypothetical protein
VNTRAPTRDYPAVRNRAGENPRPGWVETNAAAWCDLTAVTDMVMHPAIRLRLQKRRLAPDRTHYE